MSIMTQLRSTVTVRRTAIVLDERKMTVSMPLRIAATMPPTLLVDDSHSVVPILMTIVLLAIIVRVTDLKIAIVLT